MWEQKGCGFGVLGMGTERHQVKERGTGTGSAVENS